jgi:putative restriction endonuclease
MKYWLGVTDNEWFRFLSARRPDEVNFWQPSGRAPFVRLSPGAPFLFKLKSPHNHVAGGGYLVKFTTLPLSLAWLTFAETNGAPSQEAFEALIRPRLRNPLERDPEIGCSVLSAPFFWPREKWIPSPPGWGTSVQVGRYYDTAAQDGALLWEQVQLVQADSLMVLEPEARYGDPVLIRPRLGQGGFRVVVTDAYERSCAITGEHTLPVLEAAHVKPFAEGGPNELRNGVLLRADFHKLFDAGLVTITPELKIEVSSRIKEEWFNGKIYYRLHGQKLTHVPRRPEDRPSREYLEWHNERFVA